MYPCFEHLLKNDSPLKLDDFYFANGVYSDIWRGSYEGNAVAVKVWRGASLPFASRVKFVAVGGFGMMIFVPSNLNALSEIPIAACS